MTRQDIEAQIASYLALIDDSIAEGDTESAEELAKAVERACDLLDAMA